MPLETVSCAALKRIASVAISAAIGAFLLTAHPLALAATCVAPTIWLLQRNRLSAYLCACSYYAAAIWPVIPVVSRFNHGHSFIGTAIWIAGVTALGLPWLIFHSNKRGRAPWCGLGAAILSVVPPLGLIGVACPLSAAGFLFPGFKIVGLIGAAMLPGLLAWRPNAAIPVAAMIIAVAHFRYRVDAPEQATWIGVDTTFTGDSGALGDYGRIQSVLNRAEREPGKTLVFPEGTIRSWTPTTLEFFADRIAALRAHGTTILLGVLVPQLSQVVPAASYRNAVLQIGDTTELVDQRVPVPFGMWHPFARGGVQLHAWRSGIARVGNERVATLICYEELLPWPGLISTFSTPTLAAGVANDFWVSGTPIPALQSVYLRGWGRLWRVPTIAAAAN